jgi:hypothetical protein
LDFFNLSSFYFAITKNPQGRKIVLIRYPEKNQIASGPKSRFLQSLPATACGGREAASFWLQAASVPPIFQTSLLFSKKLTEISV